MPNRKIHFCNKFAIKTLPCYRCKYWHRKSKVSPYIIWYIFALHADVIWSKSQKCTKCADFWQKNELLKTFLTNVDATFQDVFLYQKQLSYGKLLIFRLLSFSVLKIMVVWHMLAGLKLHQTWQTERVSTTQSVALSWLSCMRPWDLHSHEK